MTTPGDDPRPDQALQLRTATADDFDGVWSLLERAFGTDLDDVESHRAVFEPHRNLLFTDGDRVVANAGAYTRELSVPGAAVPAAHVTLVGVHPTYRRRGLLTRLMDRQLRDVRAAGTEPVAVLWASEGRIYQRFGYGAAARRVQLEGDRRDVRFLPRVGAGTGRLREATQAEARKEMVEVFERVRRERPGWSSRDDAWWDHVLADPKERRDGATARYVLLYEGGDGVEGYARWRTKPDWAASAPQSRVEIREVAAATPEAYTAMWRFLLSVDLSRTVNYWAAAVDEPVLHLLDEPRVLAGEVTDSLWVRVVDVPAALVARHYAAPVELVLDVEDALLPDNAGRWRLRTSGAQSTCEPADGPADLAIDVADLGAAYLGATSLGSLAAAGRIRELRPGAVVAANAAFGWSRAPQAMEVF